MSNQYCECGCNEAAHQHFSKPDGCRHRCLPNTVPQPNELKQRLELVRFELREFIQETPLDKSQTKTIERLIKLLYID